jgi:hypothetical protein
MRTATVIDPVWPTKPWPQDLAARTLTLENHERVLRLRDALLVEGLRATDLPLLLPLSKKRVYHWIRELGLPSNPTIVPGGKRETRILHQLAAASRSIQRIAPVLRSESCSMAYLRRANPSFAALLPPMDNGTVQPSKTKKKTTRTTTKKTTKKRHAAWA